MEAGGKEIQVPPPLVPGPRPGQSSERETLPVAGGDSERVRPIQAGFHGPDFPPLRTQPAGAPAAR